MHSYICKGLYKVAYEALMLDTSILKVSNISFYGRQTCIRSNPIIKKLGEKMRTAAPNMSIEK